MVINGNVLITIFRKHQQIEKSEFLSCGSPTGLDSRDPFDMHLGKYKCFTFEVTV